MMDRNTALSVGRRHALRLMACAVSATVLAACGGGSSNSGNSGGDTPGQAVIQGKVTYDSVPTAVTVAADGTAVGGLDYPNTQKLPVRHALVELVSADGSTVLGSTSTDDTGAYSLPVTGGKQVYVRVTAQASDGPAASPDYAVQIRDNTAPEYKTAPGTAPIYSMRGSVFAVATGTTNLDLNAGSGWTGSSYGAPRTAGPFAILDQIVNAAQKLHNAAPNVPLPSISVFWSINNRPTDGEASNGFITTSHYTNSGAGKGLYILGAENVDTDEYDSSVVVHEFGHYVEANVSRSDSVGGSHATGDQLDMRVSFGEGWGNSFSSMMRGSPVYTDTSGPKQATIALYMRLDELEKGARPYWYDESAIGNFLYSIAQSPNIGFAPLYQTLLTGEKTTPAETSAFSFAAALRPSLSTAGKQTLDELLAAINVQGGDQLDAWGTATQFNGDPADANPAVYPVYVPLTAGQTVTACTTTQFGTGNKLGNYSHLHLTVPAAGNYQFAIAPGKGTTSTKDFAIAAYMVGKSLKDLTSNTAVTTFNFPAPGDYSADVASAADTDEDTPAGKAPRCVNVTMQPVNQ